MFKIVLFLYYTSDLLFESFFKLFLFRDVTFHNLDSEMAGREGAGGGNQYVVSVTNFNFFTQVKLGNTKLGFLF